MPLLCARTGTCGAKPVFSLSASRSPRRAWNARPHRSIESEKTPRPLAEAFLLRLSAEQRQQRLGELAVELRRGAHVAQAVLADLLDAAVAIGARDLRAVDRALGALDVEAAAPVVELVLLAPRAVEAEDLVEVDVLVGAVAVAAQVQRGRHAELRRADHQDRAVEAA